MELNQYRQFKAEDGVVPVVTAVPPVEPEVVVTLYCTPFTKIAMLFYLTI
jgi:hypothetical protein